MGESVMPASVVRNRNSILSTFSNQTSNCKNMNSTLESTEALILSGDGYELAVAPDIIEQKEQLLKYSAMVVEVHDSISSDVAGGQIKKLAAMRILVEKSRNEVKKPVLAVGKRIDDLAKDFQTALTEEENRLKRLQGDYAAAVIAERNRVLRELEAARQAEVKRLAAEQAEAEKIEAARIAAEQKAWEADSPEDEAAADKAIEDAKAAELKRLEEAAKAQAAVVVPTFVPEAVKGVKMICDFELLDIDRLYRVDASLVKMEPKRAEILAAIARLTVGETLPEIPGLRVFLKPQVR